MNGTEWTDEEILEAMTLSDEGVMMKDIGAIIGRSKNSVIGTVNRIRKEIAKQDPVGNDTMPPLWWKAGLEKRNA